MSYFADIKCPKCGKQSQLHLGGFGFYGVDSHHCDYCGTGFNPRNHCVNMVQDRDEPPRWNDTKDEDTGSTDDPRNNTSNEDILKGMYDLARRIDNLEKLTKDCRSDSPESDDDKNMLIRHLRKENQRLRQQLNDLRRGMV